MGLYDVNNHGVDVGIVNQGDGWMPCYYDTKAFSGTSHYGGNYTEYIADSSATNALMVVKPGANLSHVHLFVQFLNSSGVAICTFDQELLVAERSKWSRYYRFASLVQDLPQDAPDVQTDETYMTGGKFTNLGLYNKSTGSYEAWGIHNANNLVQDAWIMYLPKCQVTTTDNSDSFTIMHWA